MLHKHMNKVKIWGLFVAIQRPMLLHILTWEKEWLIGFKHVEDHLLKCVEPPYLRKSNCASPSPAARAHCRSNETKTTDSLLVKQPAAIERTGRTSIKKMADISSSINDPACSLWVKRLQHKHSETLSLCTKSVKNCDGSSIEKQNLCSRKQNFNTVSNDANRCVKEHKFEKIEEALQSWIKRWHCNHYQASPAALRPVALEEFKLSEKLEGKKFASVGAMALMGRAMNNYRPCRIRRIEASLVWTT